MALGTELQAPEDAEGRYRALMQCRCGILHGSEVTNPADNEGCRLVNGHQGPHEFADAKGQLWQWETDLECDCEHCQLCEGDYCTVYWRKP